MFEFKYERFLLRFSFTIAFVAFLGVFLYAYLTELNVKPPPENHAPFISAEETAQGTTVGVEDISSLDKAHRTNKELQGWINMAVSESLSFDTQSYQKVMEQVKPYFTSYGFRQYQDYLKSSQILKTIQDNDYRISVIVEEKPILLNGAAMEGAYRWLYELPITISFISRYTNNLSGGENIVNRKLSLRVQIRRVVLDGDTNAMQIESWVADARR